MTGEPEPPRLSREEWAGVRGRSARRERGRRLARGVVRTLLAVFRPLPFPVALVAGECLGLLAWAVLRSARRRAADHLDRALGHRLDGAARRRTVRRVFVNAGRSAAEILVARRTGAAAFQPRIVAVDGDEHFTGALAAGRGIVGLTAHFGNWEMLAASLGLRCDLRVVGKTSRPGDATELVQDIRAGFGLETIEQNNVRGILRALRGGAMVGILPDQDIDRQAGIFVPFFGRDAYTPTGPATLAIATGAPLLPLFLRREGRSRHRLVFHPPIFADPAAPDRDAEVRRLTAAWSAVFEEEIAARPDLWVWFHRRWKTTPEVLSRVREQRSKPVPWRERPPD